MSPSRRLRPDLAQPRRFQPDPGLRSQALTRTRRSPAPPPRRARVDEPHRTGARRARTGARGRIWASAGALAEGNALIALRAAGPSSARLILANHPPVRDYEVPEW